MCGICGRYNYISGAPVSEVQIRQMCALIQHRGPDDEGYFFNGEIGFGHRRLSIIDIETGHQPIFNEDGSVVIVFNGEIYNFIQLRKELEERGHRFYTKSDTEVIVHLYEDLGTSCVEKLRGMFAFAIWSERERRLLLVRDRIGQKPLNYAIESGGLTFSSEIRPILGTLNIKREIDLEALNDYLTLMYVPSPKTIFKGIRKLPPGHIMIVEKGGVKIERYWDLVFSEKLKMKESDYAERIMELLKEATSLRLISDVPLGAFLSGGIDSSMVVGIMAQLMDQPVKTFSIGFDVRSYDELQYAKVVAKKFGTDHHEFGVKFSAIDILPKLTLHYGEPFGDASAIPTYYVSKFTREYVTVTLNGDGGDESFAGYNRYHEWTLLEKVIKRLNEFTEEKREIAFRNMIKRAGEASVGEKTFLKYANWIMENWNLTPGERYAMWMSTFPTSYKRLLYSDEMKRGLERLESTIIVEHFNNSKARDLLDKALWVDIMTYLPEDLLVKMDIASMACSLETRSPFLDHKLVEFVARIPAHLKLRRGISKYILKRLSSKILPDVIRLRRKMGFGVPIDHWLRGELKDLAYKILLEKKSVARSYFNPPYIKVLLDEHVSGKLNHSTRIWTLLCFEVWHRMFIDNGDIRNPSIDLLSL